MKGKKARTRQAIRDTIQQHLGEVKLQLPKKHREKGQPHFSSVDIPSLRARADDWLTRNGLPTSDAEREPEAVMANAPHRARIVHTTRAGESGRARRISVIVSPETHRVLGEQG